MLRRNDTTWSREDYCDLELGSVGFIPAVIPGSR
jgi:hypothetical protein